MSLKRKTLGTLATITLIGAGVAGVSGSIGGVAGAWSDSDSTPNYSATTGELDLTLTDADNVGTVELDYVNLFPGNTQVDEFTVTNDGTIPMNVKMGAPFNQGPNSLPTEQPNMLTFSIDGFQSSTPVAGFVSTVSLGSLAPNESRTYVVRTALDGDAGNVWMNRSVDVDFTVTGTQQ